MFSLEAVSKQFPGAFTLGPLSLEIGQGESVVLIGPSGCGKSTLLRMCLGLAVPDSGMVRFKRRPLRELDLAEVRRRLGYVVQGGGLFPHLTAAENITLLARHLRWTPARVDARMAELMELTRFPAEALARYPAELSGGQAQRISLMRALMLEPEVLLLDEPLGALDPITRFELQRDLRAIFQRVRTTVLLVTHDLGEAAFFAQRLVLMRDGQIVQVGTVDELIHSPADPFVTRFVHAQRSPLEALEGPR